MRKDLIVKAVIIWIGISIILGIQEKPVEWVLAMLFVFAPIVLFLILLNKKR
jgi:hypothetical protein